jgi:anhydro-N-acetylmuramic acid kinase
MTAQIGDGATIAAITKLPVVSDLRAMDIALGGQGAPIVPIGERLLFGQYNYLLNIGGIANLSVNAPNQFVAFDICAANRILNLLVDATGAGFDKGGAIAASGAINNRLLVQLNALDYYLQPFPKSLSNGFGLNTVLPIIQSHQLSTADALCTYVHHIVQQITLAVKSTTSILPANTLDMPTQLLCTGGGILNGYLRMLLATALAQENIQLVVPDDKFIQYKEALIMGFIGVLRWREEVNVFASVTGASHNSIGGALWLGNSE